MQVDREKTPFVLVFTHGLDPARVSLFLALSTDTEVDGGSTFAWRRSTLDCCLGGQRSASLSPPPSLPVSSPFPPSLPPFLPPSLFLSTTNFLSNRLVHLVPFGSSQSWRRLIPKCIIPPQGNEREFFIDSLLVVLGTIDTLD